MQKTKPKAAPKPKPVPKQIQIAKRTKNNVAKVLVLTSCTGEKALDIKRFGKADALKGRKHVQAITKQYMKEAVLAKDLYIGGQQINLMKSVSQASFVDLKIVSAGYGIIDGNDKTVGYDSTFKIDNKKPDCCHSKSEQTQLANALEIPSGFKKLLQDKSYDCGLILLGDDYLNACDPFTNWNPAFPTIFFGTKNSIKNLKLIPNVKWELANQTHAKKYSAGVTSLKGKLGALILEAELEKPGTIDKCLDPNISLYSVI